MSLLKALATEMATCWVRLLSGQKKRESFSAVIEQCATYTCGVTVVLFHMKRRVHIKIKNRF